MIDLKKVIKYLIIIVVLFSFSCKDKLHDDILEQQQNKQDIINKTPEGKTLKIEFNKFETLVLEGCEYIIYKEHPANNTAMGFMAHKGNCKNPIHCKTE